MPSEEECNVFRQDIARVEEHMNTKFREVHNHYREMRQDFHDHLLVEEDRHRENILSRTLNTEAIEALTLNTQGMVDAWKTIANLARFVVWVSTIAGAVAGLYTIFNYTL